MRSFFLSMEHKKQLNSDGDTGLPFGRIQVYLLQPAFHLEHCLPFYS